jgi:LacI family transcriptional regulator
MNESQDFIRSKSGQLAEMLRGRISAGEWVKSLPSERVLAKEFLVSRSCLRSALEILSNDKVIGESRQSLPREILSRSITPVRRTREIRLATSVADITKSPHLLFQLTTLRKLLAPANLLVEKATVPGYNATDDPSRGLQRMVEAAPDRIWVLHLAAEKVQRWFAENKIPCLVFGSTFAGIDLPKIDIDFRGAGRHAAGRLLSLGHRRIGVMMSRTILAGDEYLLAGINDALQSHLDDAGMIPEPLVLRHDFHVERLASTLDKTFSRLDRPTALIIHNEHHLLTTVTHLMSRGIRIPEDVSVISLVNDSALERLSPAIDRYCVGDRLIEALARGVMSLYANESRALKRSILPEPIPGRSVASWRAPAKPVISR